MTAAQRYPFKLVNMFVKSIALRRDAKLSSNLELPTEIGIQKNEPGFPRIQLAMKISSPTDTPVSFALEVIGLFDYIGPKSEYDRTLIKEFVEERASHMLFVYCSQLLKIVSSQLGMNPLNLSGPSAFEQSQAIPRAERKKAPKRKTKSKNPA